MRKLISLMHVSLGGYCGGPKGEMDWIGFMTRSSPTPMRLSITQARRSIAGSRPLGGADPQDHLLA